MACEKEGCLNCKTYGYPCANCLRECEPWVKEPVFTQDAPGIPQRPFPPKSSVDKKSCK